MTIIQARGLSKSINHQFILQDITFEAMKGEVIALIGHSGSGKSTLLRCLDLLTLPDAGMLTVGEQVLTFGRGAQFAINAKTITAFRKKIGIVFQQFNLWPHLSVLQNLIIGPFIVLKQNKSEAIAEAEALLSKMGLMNKRDVYPGQLSGGQQQRVAIARSLMMKPEIMLFDEPTSALDPAMVGEIVTTLQQLAAEGMTMFIATHELRFARKLAHRTIFLDKGCIIEQGETAQLFNHPKSERLQSFIEAINY